ncbi:hypothetical protein A33K_12821 [Burkholderia humptydooensis MSMB43]|uniref:Uncharacterized protein n=1 Tax=Burkholderia humptydooensis MSMB43 TaxID=441157 RepID=A0ABN0GAV6_9BURK|nr:hypothetical protein A33K_12821 [Burkholderia humptydooensis MSMB43]
MRCTAARSSPGACDMPNLTMPGDASAPLKKCVARRPEESDHATLNFPTASASSTA